jgi:hypothetical protein
VAECEGDGCQTEQDLYHRRARSDGVPGWGWYITLAPSHARTTG